jgi:hypothetical protein
MVSVLTRMRDGIQPDQIRRVKTQNTLSIAGTPGVK